ncbi:MULTISPECIES: restriction endonuclease subunit S [Achromobacter]|uniref:restriction endonuclease subunit S n=1 Tax=Achromobacter TaxID=222 RepID=UPI0013E3BDD2|nr:MULTISPECIES: restriction endonuclease subunit S [Achromobacter]NGT13013.1 restriction endonuclease subunit S [Achromobacter insolitus]
MSGSEREPLVPQLRFPEFSDDQPWSFQPLGKLAKRSTQKNADSNITRVLTNSAEYGVIDQRDFFDKDIANQGNLEGYYIVEEGDYVYNPRISATAPVGPVSKNRIGLGVMSPLYTVFRFNNKQNDFYAYYFKSTHWHQYMRQASSTGARHDRMSIKNDDFMGLPLPVSKPKEQQKIADCLSSLDDLITAEAQKLDTLKTHKKGLMQQLFPREGETVPRRRFPEFRDMPEWAEKNLGEICKIQRGKFSHRPRNDPRFFGGKYPFIQTGDVVKSNGGSVQASQTLNELGLGVSKLFKPPIVLITIAANIGDTGLLDSEACFTDSVAGLIPNFGVSAVFLELAVRGKKEHLNKIAPAAAQKNINNEILSALPVLMPSFDEQQRIASCLSSLDDLISVQTQKIDALKAHKNSLMQQLFPAISEGEQ